MISDMDRPSRETVLAASAQAMGLTTVTDAKAALLRQAAAWWQGSLYYCPLCDEEFREADAAARHLIGLKHPVLRWEAASWPDIEAEG
ncbi:MAG: C2H2-type zinc finger protein [Chloroflexi bacterium]|nr:C2H2-type zinc finger protein [Chloroflexota bacterium]